MSEPQHGAMRALRSSALQGLPSGFDEFVGVRAKGSHQRSLLRKCVGQPLKSFAKWSANCCDFAAMNCLPHNAFKIERLHLL